MKRTRYDNDLPRGFRWVRVGETLQKTDEARELIDPDTWGRTGRAGQRNFTPKAYRRRIGR